MSLRSRLERSHGRRLSKDELFPDFKSKKTKFYLCCVQHCCLSFVFLVSFTFFIAILTAMTAVLVPSLIIMINSQFDDIHHRMTIDEIRLSRFVDMIFTNLSTNSKLIADFHYRTDIFDFNSTDRPSLLAMNKLLTHLQRFGTTFCSIAFLEVANMNSTYFGYQEKDDVIYYWEQYNSDDLVGYTILENGVPNKYYDVISNFTVGVRPYYRPEEANGYFGDIYFSYCGSIAMYYVHPLLSKDGKPIGIVKNNLQLDLLSEYLRIFDRPVFILNRRCEVLGTSQPELLPALDITKKEVPRITEIKDENKAKNSVIKEVVKGKGRCSLEDPVHPEVLGGTFWAYPYRHGNVEWTFLFWVDSSEFLIFYITIPLMSTLSVFTALVATFLSCCFVQFLTIELRKPIVFLKKNFKPIIELQTDDETLPRFRKSCLYEVNAINDTLVRITKLLHRLRTYLPNPAKQVAAHEIDEQQEQEKKNKKKKKRKKKKGKSPSQQREGRASAAIPPTKQGVFAMKMKQNFTIGLVRKRVGVIVTLRVKAIEERKTTSSSSTPSSSSCTSPNPVENSQRRHSNSFETPLNALSLRKPSSFSSMRQLREFDRNEYRRNGRDKIISPLSRSPSYRKDKVSSMNNPESRHYHHHGSDLDEKKKKKSEHENRHHHERDSSTSLSSTSSPKNTKSPDQVMNSVFADPSSSNMTSLSSTTRLNNEEEEETCNGIMVCHKEVYELVEDVRQALRGNLLSFSDRKYVVGFFEKEKKKKKKKRSSKRNLNQHGEEEEEEEEEGDTKNENNPNNKDRNEGDSDNNKYIKEEETEGEDSSSCDSESGSEDSDSDSDSDEEVVMIDRGKYERRACKFAIILRNQLDTVSKEYGFCFSIGIDKSETRSGFLGSVEKKLPQFTGKAKRVSNILAKYGVENDVKIVVSKNLGNLSIHYERIKIDYLFLPKVSRKLMFVYQLTRIRKITDDLQSLSFLSGVNDMIKKSNNDNNSSSSSSNHHHHNNKPKKLKRKNSVSKLANNFEKSIFLNERCWEYLLNGRLKKCNSLFRKCRYRAFTRLRQLVHFLIKFEMSFDTYVKRVMGEERLSNCSYISLLMPEMQEIVLREDSVGKKK